MSRTKLFHDDLRSPSFTAWLRIAAVLALVFAVVLTSDMVAAQEPKEKDDDFYTVPEGDIDALREFIVKQLGYRPTSRADAANHQKKVLGAVRTAAGRILTTEKDPTAKSYKMAEAVLLQLDIQDLRANEKSDAKKVVDRTLGFVKKIGKEAGGFEIELLMMLGETLESSTLERQTLAETVYTRGAKLLKNAANEDVREYAVKLEGMGRRLGLNGKEIELQGTTIDGKKFDVASHKGKVVLIDFWATWCGPCVAEIPNMLANYQRFHPHGFEIVGVSLDQDREELEDFMKKRRLPWLILHENDESGGHPAADYYGIHAIPAMFLVDRNGLVISTAANGTGLSRLLEEQFPKVLVLEQKQREAEKAAKAAKEATGKK